MRTGSNWRIPSDYIGAGNFVLERDRVVVGTPYGVQCLPDGPARLDGWKAELGSRCLGLRALADGTLLASCTGGLYLLERDGGVKEEIVTTDSLVHEAVLLPDGFLHCGQTKLHCRRGWTTPAWDYDFRDALGRSVESIRVVGIVVHAVGAQEAHVVAGAVDYDSGIGRVVVLTNEGKPLWMTDAGPLSDVFPGGRGRFGWSLTGYGKFETHLAEVSGKRLWSHDYAGVGAVEPDGSIALLVGSNESPRWDNWEYHKLLPDGREALVLQANGRCAVRALCRSDGTVFFVGSALYLDPASSRIDYTNFFRMPQELLFQHLVGIHTQVPEYDVFLHKLAPGGTELEVVYNVSGSFSLASPQALGKYVVFCDGTDIIGVEA